MSDPDSGPGQSSGSAFSVGVIIGAHGIRGGLRVKLFDPHSDALRPGSKVELRREGERESVAAVVRSVDRVPHSDKLRLFVDAIDDRDAALALRGSQVRVPRDAMPELGDDEFYLADAIGLPVYLDDEGKPGAAVGRVTGIMTGSGQDLFEIDWRSPSGRHRTWLLPVLAQFVRDVTPSHVLVQVPIGMLPEELEATL